MRRVLPLALVMSLFALAACGTADAGGAATRPDEEPSAPSTAGAATSDDAEEPEVPADVVAALDSWPRAVVGVGRPEEPSAWADPLPWHWLRNHAHMVVTAGSTSPAVLSGDRGTWVEVLDASGESWIHEWQAQQQGLQKLLLITQFADGVDVLEVRASGEWRVEGDDVLAWAGTLLYLVTDGEQVGVVEVFRDMVWGAVPAEPYPGETTPQWQPELQSLRAQLDGIDVCGSTEAEALVPSWSLEVPPADSAGTPDEGAPSPDEVRERCAAEAGTST